MSGQQEKNDMAANEAPVVGPGFKLTDLGNAERLVARFRDRVRFCPPMRSWLVWDCKRWAWDSRGEVIQFAKKTARGIYGEAEHAKDPEHARAIAKHAHASEKADRIHAMVSLAQSEPGVPVLPAELDTDPWAFNVLNGTIDLRDGSLRPHRPADLITKLAPVEFVDIEFRSEVWDRFLEKATGGDAELAAYLQRVMGYALHGRVTEKAFWFLYGPPDTSKSTYVDAVSATLGDYSAAAQFSTWLVQTTTGGNRGDLVALLGARLVVSVEVRKGARFDEELVKKVTGGDLVKAAAKFKDEITFLPTFSLWLAGNDAPVIRDDDVGSWSRVRRVPFDHVIPKAEQDPGMRDKLRAPEVQSAILAWGVRGCLEWQKNGLGTCAAVERSSAGYRSEMDRAAGFILERCVFGGIERTRASDMRDAYERWCRDEGVKVPLSGKDLGTRLTERGAKPAKANGVRFWNGVRLRTDDEVNDEPRDGRVGEGQQFLDLTSQYSSREKVLGSDDPSRPSRPWDDDVERSAIEDEEAAE